MDRWDLMVIYGSQPYEMVLDLLNEIRPEKGLDQKARIGIKPNLVLARKAETGATTHVEIVAGIIDYFKDKGYDNLEILEGSWVGDQTEHAFKICGYETMARQRSVPLIDLQKDESRICSVGDMQIRVCQRIFDLDYLINVPVLKGHCQTRMTCALKNMKGIIPNSEKRRFHAMGLHRPIALLNHIIRQDLILVDGLMGDLNFEEGGHPVPMNRIIAGTDPVLVDSYASALLGFSIDEIPYIGLSESLSVGTTDITSARIIALNEAQGQIPVPKPRNLSHYNRLVEERDACSACYGTLIHALERLSEHGTLHRLHRKIYIGQAFKGKELCGIGIGSCALGCTDALPGCPPDGRAIVDFLESLIDDA
ncbi:MAG: DUF362 domain-containing protein [Clostridia bacterium]|nr:DUF362 domain-containing protein [Clostridia bacterium]